MCKANIAKDLFSTETGQRKFDFSDTQASANSTAMEEFWYHTNLHFKRPSGEIEYSAEAGAAAHAIGRVTCQPDGQYCGGAAHQKPADGGQFAFLISWVPPHVRKAHLGARGRAGVPWHRKRIDRLSVKP